MIHIASFVMAFFTLFSQLFTVSQQISVKDCDSTMLTVTEPIENGGNDPWFIRHEGTYYYCYSVGNGVAVKKSDSLTTLTSAEPVVVYRAPEGTMYSYSYWAPELHYLDGEWYIYVAADNGNNQNHRMYVLKGTSQDASDPFEMVGKITDPTDLWAIDGTVLEYKNERYFVWSGWAGTEDGQQNLYIAHMSDPMTIDSERVLINVPSLSWETKGMPINEGPAVLKKDNTVYIVYSASGSWTDDYCLGMLKLTGDNLLRKSSWAKCPNPVFKKADGSVYGPGHCSFISSPDGKTDYIVYHGNTVSGTGWNGRQTRIQRFIWMGDVPVFGKPLKDGSVIYINE